MYAIISELDRASNLAIEKLTTDFIAECNINLPPMKWSYHLSWQGARSYALEETENRIRMIARTFAPIETRIDGLGIFTGKEPVLYLTVTRTPLLSALNETVWEALHPLAEEVNPYFSPEEWVPHISILYGDDKSAPGMSCAVEKLIRKELRISIKIDHLSLGFFQDQENGAVFRYPLTGEVT